MHQNAAFYRYICSISVCFDIKLIKAKLKIILRHLSDIHDFNQQRAAEHHGAECWAALLIGRKTDLSTGDVTGSRKPLLPLGRSAGLVWFQNNPKNLESVQNKGSVSRTKQDLMVHRGWRSKPTFFIRLVTKIKDWSSFMRKWAEFWFSNF